MFVDALLERLVRGARDGAWAYGYRSDSGSSEAAALAALALRAHQAAPEIASAALDWLADTQVDGRVPVTNRLVQPWWPTPMALLAWSRVGDGGYREQIDAAREYLLATRGRRIDNSPLVGHDMTLIGWPWVEDTHSWVEPTGYTILGLRASGDAEHERVREAVRLLDDRCLPEGGWNYGNTRVLHNVLRPFPATTGVALAALTGEERTDAVQNSIEYLAETAPTLNAPMSLSWSVLALRAWDHDVDPTPWLERSALQPGRRPPDPVHDALLLLAAAPMRIITHGLEDPDSVSGEGHIEETIEEAIEETEHTDEEAT